MDDRRSLPSSTAIRCFLVEISLHEVDVIVLRHVAVLLEIRSFVLRHGLYEIVDEFFWNERMTKVKFRDVWL